jgi:hypothetical protein
MVQARHEGKACDAVVRYIEAHRRIKRGSCWSPENEGHKYPIDLACQMDDGSQWGFEHTSIQAFENQIGLSIKATRFKDPIEKAMSQILPCSEQYILYFPLQEIEGLDKNRMEAVQNVIVDWLREVTPTLTISPSFGELLESQRQISVSGVPFPLSICRCQKEIDSDDSLWIFDCVVGDLQEARKVRIERAFDDKLKKLVGWKKHARTALVFENIDGPIHWLVADIARDLAKARHDMPDEVYSVMTGRDAWWWVSPILVDDVSLHHRNSPSEWAWRIDPRSLESLTGR